MDPARPTPLMSRPRARGEPRLVDRWDVSGEGRMGPTSCRGRVGRGVRARRPVQPGKGLEAPRRRLLSRYRGRRSEVARCRRIRLRLQYGFLLRQLQPRGRCRRAEEAPKVRRGRSTSAQATPTGSTVCRTRSGPRQEVRSSPSSRRGPARCCSLSPILTAPSRASTPTPCVIGCWRWPAPSWSTLCRPRALPRGGNACANSPWRRPSCSRGRRRCRREAAGTAGAHPANGTDLR